MISRKETPCNAVGDVLATISISEVYRALGGGELRHGRGRAFWRGGDGWSVSLDDDRGVWHDFVDDEGGGVLDLITKVRGGSRADALRWCAELAGVSLDDPPLSQAERNCWAQQRRLLEQQLPKARYWRRAAVEMFEQLLQVMKAALAKGIYENIDFDGLRKITSQLAYLQRIEGPELIAEFREWMENHPQLTSAMIQAAQTRESAERRAIQMYIAMNFAEASLA